MDSIGGRQRALGREGNFGEDMPRILGLRLASRSSISQHERERGFMLSSRWLRGGSFGLHSRVISKCIIAPLILYYQLTPRAHLR